MPVTIKADIPTGLPCDACGALLYIRRADDSVLVCSSYGHEWPVPLVLKASLSVIQKLAEGQV